MKTGIHIHQHHRMEQLSDRLAEVLLEHAPADPFEPQYVVVGSSGMEEWLRGALTARLPVVAAIKFGFAPGLGDWLIGGDASRAGQWRVGNLVWNVLAALRALANDPDLATVNSYFARVAAGHDEAPAAEGAVSVAEYEIARQIASLFERYTRNAPALCRSFDDGLLPGALQAHPDARWQMRIWRWIRDHAPDNAHIPGLLAELFAADPLPAHVPRQINIFGLSNLPAVHYEAIARLADRIRVDWYLLTPTRMYIGEDRRQALEEAWATDATMEKSPLLLAFGKATRGAQRMTLDLQQAVGDAPFVQDDLFDDGVSAPPARGSDGPRAVPMLERIQRGLLDDTETPVDLDPDSGECAMPVADDLSLRIYSCASDARQVEMLRESLLHLFASDPTLQPRDVLVMTPEVARFAPIIQSVFGDLGRPLAKGGTTPEVVESAPVAEVEATALSDDADERMAESVQEQPPAERVEPVGGYELPNIPYRIVDRSLREANPMAHVLVKLFSLSRSRATRSELVAFLGLEPVRARFGLSTDDVAHWAVWFERLGVRYGRDGADRASFGGPASSDLFSWKGALDRLAVSASMAATADTWYHGSAPDQALAGQRPENIGRCVRATQTVLHVAQWLTRAVSAEGWRELLLGSGDGASGLLQMVADVGNARAWMWREIVDALKDLEQGVRNGRHGAGHHGAALDDPPIQPAVLERYLDTRFDVPIQMSPTGRNAVMVCSLQPSRSVPHRVICLLGLDDGVFPRGQASVRWDLTTPSNFGGRMGMYNRMPSLAGEEGLLPLTFLDPRDGDRTLFLEAILSARQALAVFYTGRDASTGKEIPPAAPVSELMRFTRPVSTESAKEHQAATYHFEVPLHAFSESAFKTDALAGDSLRSHHPLHAELAASIADRVEAGEAKLWSWWSADATVSAPTDAQPRDVWTIREWVKWITDPIEEFSRRTLRVRPPELLDVTDDLIPVSIDGLDKWMVRDQAWMAVARTGGTIEPEQAQRIAERMVQTNRLPQTAEWLAQDALQLAEATYSTIGAPWSEQANRRVTEHTTGLTFVATLPAEGASTLLTVTASGVEPESSYRAGRTLKMVLELCAAATAGGARRHEAWLLRPEAEPNPVVIELEKLKGTPEAWLRYYARRALEARSAPPFVIGTPSVLAAGELWKNLEQPCQQSMIEAFTNDDMTRLHELAHAVVPENDDNHGSELPVMRDVALKLRSAWHGDRFSKVDSTGDSAFWTWFAADAPYWVVEGKVVDRRFLVDSLLQWFPLLESGMGVK